jgi:hypothetical protein
MSKTTRTPQAPESYGTFWEPLVGDAPSAPVPLVPVAEGPGKAKDAYLEFTEITEGVPAAPRGERS